MGKWRSLFKLKPLIMKRKLLLICGILSIIISSAIATPIPYIIGTLLDNLIKKRSYSLLYFNVILIGALYILQFVFSLLSNNVFVNINNYIVNELRYSVIEKVIDLPMSYLSKTEKGYIQGRISECTSVGNLFSPSIVSIFFSLISALMSFVTMFALNYKLSLVVVALIPVFFFSTRISTKKFTRDTKNMMESSAILNGECFEIINGIDSIKILNGKRQHLQKFKKKLDSVIAYSIRQGKSVVLFSQNINLINNIGSLLILFISSLLILQGKFTIGLYTSFSLYITKIFSSVQGLAMIETTLKPVCLSTERIYDLINMKDENYGRSMQLNSVIKTVEYVNVGFRYRSDLPDVLNNVNLEFRSGDNILLSGENGSGKTTIIKLLLGLYQPTNGEIKINGINSAELNCSDLRKRIAIVSQDIFLFRGTVLDNILYGQSEKNRLDVQNLIDALGLAEYIEKFANGLDTMISQNNEGVSGGQKQIIAFLRALLSPKQILILDEPVSNVDAKTRNLILHILENKNYDGILIVISHHAQGIKFFNKTIKI